MDRTLAILSIEDSIDDFLLIERELERSHLSCRCRNVADEQSLSEALTTEHWDLVLSDYSVPGLYFPNVLGQIKKHRRDLPVILVSGTLGAVKAAAMIKLGASDFVSKEELANLAPAIRRHLNRPRACNTAA